MNRIGYIQFDFHTQDETFAVQLNADWDRFFRKAIEPVVDTVIDRFADHTDIILIESLELDLGSIPESLFDEQYPILLREKLEEALIKNLPFSKLNPGSQNSRLYASVTHPFELLTWFLLHGTLPWYAGTKYKDISFLFMEVIRDNGKKLKQFLQTYGHYTSLQERLVYQLNDPTLEQGIRLFSPSESPFIISYIKFLTSRYKKLPKPQIREISYRRTIWRVVYAYLLTNRSSYFNKKAFIMSTIAGLASGINITYHDLLDLLTDEIETLAENTLITVELYRLLNELKEESTKEKFQTLKDLFRTELAKQLQLTGKEDLIAILSRLESCRTFLQLLDEEEIIRLVPELIPQESTFVLSYAHSLDQQQERGYLAGKAGNDFTGLKWQFIFPLLFENRGSSLNRKHFVYAVIRQIAAHYNFSFTELLIYFNRQETLLKLDKQLKEIIASLYNEMIPVPEKPKKTTRISPVQLSGYLQKGEKITHRQKQQLFIQLSDFSRRQQLFQNCREEEQKQLVRLFFKKESEWILSYVSALEKQETTKRLEGKTGRNFRQLKWELIWAIMTKDNHSAFNRRYFVADIVKKMSAHYNLRYMELLSYFCSGSSFRLFPSEIQKVLTSLYQEETGRINRHYQVSSSLIDEVIEKERIELSNAGIVLLAPWFPRLYTLLDLTEENQFKNKEAQIKAMYLIQYAVFEKTNFPEHELTLNKILVGLAMDTPVPSSLELTGREKETTLSMMEGAKNNWPKLQSSSIAALQETFLQREGMLEIKEDHFRLVVEEKAYDLLLDTLPWNFRMIKHLWMEKRIEVKWR